MNTDTDDVGAVDTARNVIELEDELRAIDGAIGAAIRAGDAIEADRLTTRKAQLPMLLSIARAYAIRLDLAALAQESSALDLAMPELARAVEAGHANVRAVEAEAKRAVEAARHGAACALAELRERQERRRAIEQSMGELRARLASIGPAPTSTSTTGPARGAAPALRVAVPGASCGRPDTIEYVIDPSIGRV